MSKLQRQSDLILTTSCASCGFMSHDCPSGEGACALTVRVVSLPRDVSQVLNSSNNRSM